MEYSICLWHDLTHKQTHTVCAAIKWAASCCFVCTIGCVFMKFCWCCSCRCYCCCYWLCCCCCCWLMSHRNHVNWYEMWKFYFLPISFLSLLPVFPRSVARLVIHTHTLLMLLLLMCKTRVFARAAASIGILHDLEYHCVFTRRFPLTRISFCFVSYFLYWFIFVLFLIDYTRTPFSM